MQNLEVLGPDGFVMQPSPWWVDAISYASWLFPVGALLLLAGLIVLSKRSTRPWAYVSVSFGLLAALATAFCVVAISGAVSASASGPASAVLFQLLVPALLLTLASGVSAIVGLIRREGATAALGLVISLLVGLPLVASAMFLALGLAMLSTG